MKTLFNRNFTFLILGQASSLLGNYGPKFALSMYVLERTGSASVFAGMLAPMLPTILLSPFGGFLRTGQTAGMSWWPWIFFPGWLFCGRLCHAVGKGSDRYRRAAYCSVGAGGF